MVKLFGPAGRNCDGTTRRGFLQWGALGLGAAGTVPVQPMRAATSRAGRANSVIVLFMAGGPSQNDTYDMKPDAPAEVRGPFRPIATRIPGLDVCELLPGHREIARHLAIVRSIHHTQTVHDDATHHLQTGHPLPNARARGQQHPSLGSVISRLTGERSADIALELPAYACIPDDYRTHAGFYEGPSFLGERHAAWNTGLDPSLARYRNPEFLLSGRLTSARLERRRGLLSLVDGELARLDAAGGPSTFSEAQARAFELMTNPRVKAALDLSEEPAGLRDAYGRELYGQGALLARRLVEAGTRFVNVNLYEKDVDWWDDHYKIEEQLRRRLPRFDAAFSTLIRDLESRGLLETTLVVACGEFGRSPRIDSGGGRGHWPGAMSVALAGGGIRGGQVVGATTPDGGEPSERPLTPGDLIATIYRCAGVDPTTSLVDREGRPTALIDRGSPIQELI